MKGRNPKPIALHLKEGNLSHLTKEEIETRQKSEIKLGQNNFECPDFIKNDEIAYKKWQELIKDYEEAAKNGIELLTSSDVGLLARYCKTFSEYINLQNQRKKNLTIEELIKIETAINKKMDMLLKMEDRLFLNPLSKVKAIIKTSQEEKPKNKFAEFLE
jgi:phage terminase small subunit